MARPTASMTAREVARAINAAHGEIRVNSLGPELQRSILRLIQAAGDDGVILALKRYRAAYLRAELHRDPATLRAFDRASQRLDHYISRLGAAEAETLRREFAQRARAVHADRETLRTEAREASARASQRRAGQSTGDALELGAALIQRTFIERLRDVVRRLKAGTALAGDERTLLQGYRKLRSVIGGEWHEGWDDVYRYARANATSIAQAERRYIQALREFEAASAAGDPDALRRARQALKDAQSGRSGFHSKIKGTLGEAYAPRWSAWREQRESLIEAAGRLATSLPGNWEVRTFAGNVRLDDAEAWDEVILLVGRTAPGGPPEAKLFMAAQYKVEKQVTAIKQVTERDVIRESAGLQRTQLPLLTIDGQREAFALTPMPADESTYRYIFNAEEGRISAKDIATLRRVNVQVQQMTLDVTLTEFNAVADGIIAAIARALE